LPQLGKRYQSLLAGSHQALAAFFNPYLFPAQILLSLAQGVRVSRDLPAAIDFGLDQPRIPQ
jgi:hypothetical protein